MTDFTILDDGRATAVAATLAGDGVRVPPTALRAATGWELKPEGLCRDDVCYSLPAGSDIGGREGLDLAGVARLLGRPLVLDVAERAASLGASAEERGARLQSLEAPDFELPDLDGRLHRLSDHRGKKVFLAAYASW